MTSTGRLVLKAPAKINLTLKVTGRRADGYHTLDSLMHKVGLFDELELKACPSGIDLSCPGGQLPEDRENLVYRAAELFFSTVAARPDRGVRMTLVKHIPQAAGLGGGSSDAAAALLGLNSLFAAGLDRNELAALGLQLGADVPFFLDPAPAARATGIGEILTQVPPLAGWSILLVNPGFPVSTRWVYQTFALTTTCDAGNLTRSQEGEALGAACDRFPGCSPLPPDLGNDLEQVTLARYPELVQLKQELLAAGAAAALMSGSGPTVFGLFADRSRAQTSQEGFRKRYRHTYLVAPLGAE